MEEKQLKKKKKILQKKKREITILMGKKKRTAGKYCEKGDPTKAEKNLRNNKRKTKKYHEFRKSDTSYSKIGGSD